MCKERASGTTKHCAARHKQINVINATTNHVELGFIISAPEFYLATSVAKIRFSHRGGREWLKSIAAERVAERSGRVPFGTRRLKI
jgi:hypothetical protein